jgi:hypothetical protein
MLFPGCGLLGASRWREPRPLVAPRFGQRSPRSVVPGAVRPDWSSRPRGWLRVPRGARGPRAHARSGDALSEGPSCAYEPGSKPVPLAGQAQGQRGA